MDNVTVQYIIVGILVLAAIWYVVKNVRKSLKGKSSCSKGCGCDCSAEKASKAN
ncbi:MULTISPECIES: FeoB-associated Cys-rich membrane protein [Sphingobacterium]|uniref:FeoB-associated Cys-rich membrane protein n=1 Tax=Sphingobacterium zeae TaxID=1776859 RepID=A0ABU0U3A7_9SPHI|nr:MULTISPECIES: FeoB-associated Cys-rich membrane protein [Sphingobacterium]MDQ1149447.1 hypothetical protein [Sphingobacterium zeae]MDR6735454.1 hypothetical protein [Sphingobacterium sp. 2149]